MIKAWPIDAKHIAYQSLCHIWTSRETPPEWKWKWLVAIPKSSDPYPLVKDLRPISLVEALRKIWISLINQQINVAITRFNILHPSQHGSIPTRGTCTASLVHLNYLEETLQSKHLIHRSSWDMKRAFDSVSKVMMRISWIRIGIPPEIADYLVQLDEGGTTVLKTPFSLHHWKASPYQSTISTTPIPSTYQSEATDSDNPSLHKIPTFQAENGTGQGDVTSSTIWACFLDILLTMLHNDSLHNPSMLYGENGHQYPMQEIAYVDDIESSTFTSPAMQRKADIVSAFCIITGIQLSHSKLRRSITACPKYYPFIPIDEFQSMKVHTTDTWVAQSIRVKHDQYTEYLGIKNDLQGQPYTTQLNDTFTQLKQFLHQLTFSTASPQIKIDVLTKSVYPAVQYPMRITTYPLSTYHSLDSEIYKLLLKITRTSHGFPYALLHLPAKYVGLGIPRLSDQIQYSKLGILLRSLHAPPNSPHHNAIKAILSRQATLQHNTITTNQAVSLTPSYDNLPSNWLCSLIQWLDSHKLHLRRQGTLIQSLLPLATPSQTTLLLQWNIQYVQDILPSFIPTTPPLHLPTQLNSLHDLLQPMYPDFSTTILRQHQLWKLQPAKEGIATELQSEPASYAEILGWEEDSKIVHVQIWQPIPFEKTILRPTSTSSVEYDNIFPPHTLHERYLYHQSPSNNHLEQITILQHPILRKAPSFSLPYSTVWESLLAPHALARSIFISHSIHHISLASTILIPTMMSSRPTSACTGYIYVTSTNSTNTKTTSIYTINNLLDYITMSQVDMFLSTICLHLSAHHHLHPTISPTHSSTIKSLTDSTQQTNFKSPNFQLITSALQQIKSGARLGAHIQTEEITNHQQTFQYLVKLIRQHKLQQPSPIHQVSLSKSAILSNLFDPNTWLICTKEGSPLLMSAVTHVNEQIYREYLRERLLTSQTSHDWEDSTPLHTSNAFKLYNTSLSTRISLTRVLYDKCYHGRNIKKYYPDKPDTCNNCHLPDSIYHWMCQCSHITSAFSRHTAITNAQEKYAKNLTAFNRMKEEKPTSSTKENQRHKRLLLSNISTTVGKFFMDNLQHPPNAVRLWTSNWSIPMIEDLYSLIKLQQYSPTFFSIVIHRTVYQAILEMSQILALGLIEIWKCKAATIHNQRNPNKQLSFKPKKNTPTSSINPPPTNTITRYFQPSNIVQTPTTPTPTELNTFVPNTTDPPVIPNQTPITQLALPSLVIPLSDEQNLQLQYAFQLPSDETILINKFNIIITKETIQCLNPSQPNRDQWLNDKIINFYLNMVKEKFYSDYNKLHIFDSCFMENLSPTRTSSEVSSFNYNAVAKYTHFRRRKNINLFQKEMVLIPINYHNQHWTLAVIYPKQREVSYYDSMKGTRIADDYLHIIQRYLTEEANVTHTTFDPLQWTFHQPQVPQQINCHDCGIYLLLFAHLLVHGISIESINPEDIPLLRKTICNSIQNGTLPSIAPPNLVLPTPTPYTRPTHKRKAAFQGSYNEDHIERKRRNQPTEFPRPPDLHLHPADKEANKKSGIATSRISQGGLGLFALQEREIGDIVGLMFGGVKLNKETLHLHSPSLYAYYDDHNEVYIDPYDPKSKYISCSAAYVNDNIQQPDRNNTEFVTFTDGTAGLRVIKKIFKYEEYGTRYGPDHWKTLEYPLTLLLIAQKAYNKEHDPEWITLIATKRAKDAAETKHPSPAIDVNSSPLQLHTELEMKVEATDEFEDQSETTTDDEFEDTYREHPALTEWIALITAK